MAKAKRASKSPKLTLEQRLLLEQLRGAGYAALPEVRFHPRRKWRIDVSVCAKQVSEDYGKTWRDDQPLAIEIDGGAWSRGRHVRGKGFIEDMAKQNALTELGWRILRFTPQQVRDGSALAQIRRCL